MTEPASAALRKEIAEQAEQQQAAASRLEEREGRKYLIRPVTQFEMAAAGMKGPLLEMMSGDGTPEEKEKAVRMDSDKWFALQEGVVAHGLLAPVVWAGLPEKCPKGHVTLPAINADIVWLFGRIMDLSGYTVEAAQAVSFPDQEQAGPRDGGDSAGGGDAPEPSGSVAPRGVGV